MDKDIKEIHDAFGTVSTRLFHQAIDYYQDNRERSEEICRLLLRYPQLGDMPKAGCHLILATGSENYM